MLYGKLNNDGLPIKKQQDLAKVKHNRFPVLEV